MVVTCTEATPDHNNGTGTSAIIATHDDPIQHIKDTATGPAMKYHTGHTATPLHTTAHQATTVGITVDCTPNHLTDCQNIVHTKKGSYSSGSYSSQGNQKSHLRRNTKVQIEEPQLDYYSSDDHSTDSGEESVFKLVEPSSSSDTHEQGELPSNKHVTIALIMDCPTITVHMAKCYKALIDSGAAISLVRYSTYQTTDNSLKIAIQATSIQLNTDNGSPMRALGIKTLQLSIADFKFSHNFIICDRLPEMELLFGINVPKKLSLPYT